MRHLIASIIAVFLLSFSANAQSYTVIHIIGKIYDSNSEKYLSKGMKVSENATLKFETSVARAAVLSSSRGRFVIQKNKGTTSTSDAFYALSSVISPVRGRLSTRAGAINNSLDFEKHFNEAPVALLGAEHSVSVSSSSYPMSDNQFFFIQYQFEGETINKKLSKNGENLVIKIPEFYSIDETPINPSLASDFKLNYYNAVEGTSTVVCSMQLVAVSNAELKSLMKELENDQSEVLEIINDLYGKCSKSQLSEAIKNLN